MKQYHCLIAGLRELAAEGERKEFAAVEAAAEIRAELSQLDARAAALLYAAYDVENIVAHRQGSERYNPLGNVLKEALDAPKGLPKRLQKTVVGYSDENEDEEFDASERFEKALWEAWYADCAASGVSFLRHWAAADRIIRSAIAGVRVDDADEELAERAKAIVAEPNLIERERKLAALRWALAEEYSERHYFDITALLAYLAKIAIIANQMQLDAVAGRELLRQMTQRLTPTTPTMINADSD